MTKPYYISLTPLLPWRSESHPIAWERRFSRKAPLELEIGFGNGDALAARAAAERSTDFIGVEVAWESIKRGLRRIARLRLENVALLQADARIVLERLIEPRALARVTCLFPCPWPKERHARHRLFGTEFLRLMNSRMEDGAEARIVTDFDPFRTWLEEQIPGSRFEARYRAIPPTYGTKYERKWSDLGQAVFHEFVLTKKEHVSVPPKRDVTMRIHSLERFDPERFEPADVTGDLTVSFKELLFDGTREKGMVRVFVGEEGLQQEFWVEIVRLQDRWKIRPAAGCAFVPTAGAQKALDLVQEGASRL